MVRQLGIGIGAREVKRLMFLPAYPRSRRTEGRQE
jgi:hypothetical protein